MIIRVNEVLIRTAVDGWRGLTVRSHLQSQSELYLNQSLISSTDVIRLTLTLKMTAAQVDETTVKVNKSPIMLSLLLKVSISILSASPALNQIASPCLVYRRIIFRLYWRSHRRWFSGPGQWYWFRYLWGCRYWDPDRPWWCVSWNGWWFVWFRKWRKYQRIRRLVI